MRKALFALAALSLTTPAFAQSQATREMEDVAETLNSPINRALAAGAIGAAVDAVLDVRIDGFTRALEPLTGRAPRDSARTVRELAERDDPYFEQNLQRGTREAIGSMGAVASALAIAMPEFEAAMRRLEDALPLRR